MYNLSEMLTNCHKATRAVCRLYAGADYRATFSCALRLAWADELPTSAREEWESMDGETQYSALVAMVWYARERDLAGTDKQGNPRSPKMQWIVSKDDALSCANDAYCRMDAMLSRNEERDEEMQKSLSVILFRAVYTAAQYIDRHERRHARALRFEDMGDGTERQYIQIADKTDGALDPYGAVACVDALNRACNDATDGKIVMLKAQGFNSREIAEYLGLRSHTSVNKRFKGIDARYHGTAESAEG